MSQSFNAIAGWLLNHRRWIVVLALLLTAVAGSQIPRVTADFTPNDLFASLPEEEAIAAEFRETFGNTDSVLLMVVSAPDIFEPDVLQYLQDASTELARTDWAGRVTSITTLPLPRPDTTPAAAETDDVLPSLGAILYARAARLSHAVAPLLETTDSDPEPLGPAPAWLSASGAESPDTPARPTNPIVTPTDAAFLADAVDSSPLLRGQLVSADHTVATVVVQLGSGIDRARDVEAAVVQARALIGAHALPEGVEVRWAGLPYLRTALVERMRRDQAVMMPASIVVCIIILLLAFRWVPGILLPLATVIMTAVQLVGLMAIVGESFNILNNIIPLLILIIGISDSIHLISRYAEEIRAGRTTIEAARNTLSTMAAACFMTSFTTAVGFATLAVSHTELLQRFGITAAVGVMLAYLLTVLFIPAALPSVSLPPARGESDGSWLEDTIEKATHTVMRNPWPALALSTGLFVAAGWLSTNVVVDAAVLDQFDEDDELTVTTRTLEEKLSGFRPLEIYLRAPDGAFLRPEVVSAVESIAAWAVEQDGVLRATSWVTYAREARAGVQGQEHRNDPFSSPTQLQTYLDVFAGAANNPVRAYLSEDGTRARLNLAVRDVGAARTIELAHALQDIVSEALADSPDVEARLTGVAYTSSAGLRSVINDLAGSLSLATVVIFVFMTLLFRSLKLGLISIPPNVLPLLMTLAFMALTGIPLNAATVIIFSVSIGLAVDGTIHVLARFREEQALGLSTEEAMSKAARGTGKAIVLTSLSLLFGFSVMLLSAFVPVRRFGILIGVSMFSCLIATLFVLPALIAIAWPDKKRTAGAAEVSVPGAEAP
jgi:hypothetical protein